MSRYRGVDPDLMLLLAARLDRAAAEADAAGRRALLTLDMLGWASAAPLRLDRLASWATTSAGAARRRAARAAASCAAPGDQRRMRASGVLGGLSGAFARGFVGAAAGTVRSTVELASVGIGNVTAPARALAATVESGPRAGMKVFVDQSKRNVRVVVATAEGVVVSVTDTALLPVHFVEDARERGLTYAAEEAAEQAGESAFAVAAVAATGGIARAVGGSAAGGSAVATTAARGASATGARGVTLVVTAKRALKVTGAHTTGAQRRTDRDPEERATTVEACATER